MEGRLRDLQQRSGAPSLIQRVRTEAIADALAFRRERRHLFPGAADKERARRDPEKGLRHTPASRPGPIRPGMPSVPRRQASQGAPPRLSSERSPTRRVPRTVCCWITSCPDGRQVRATSDLRDLLASAAKLQPTTNVGRRKHGVRCVNAANRGGGARSSAAGPKQVLRCWCSDPVAVIRGFVTSARCARLRSKQTDRAFPAAFYGDGRPVLRSFGAAPQQQLHRWTDGVTTSPAEVLRRARVKQLLGR